MPRRPQRLVTLSADRLRVQLLTRGISEDELVEELRDTVAEEQVRGALRGRMASWDVVTSVLAAIHAHPADCGLPELVADVIPAFGS